MEVDLKTSIWLSGAVVPSMLQNTSTDGIIINISLTPATVGHIEGAPYLLPKLQISQ